MLEKYLKSQSLGRGFVSGRGRAHARIGSITCVEFKFYGARALKLEHAELNCQLEIAVPRASCQPVVV